VEKPFDICPFGTQRKRQKNNINMHLRERVMRMRDRTASEFHQEIAPFWNSKI
jgi:hypothetical protein